MRKIYTSIVFMSLFLSQPVPAAEIDSVTTRKIKLDNSITAINEIINQRIQQGIRNANEYKEYLEELDMFVEEDEYCKQEVLYTELRKAVFQTYSMAWGLKGYQLDVQFRTLLSSYSYSLSLNDSVYRDIDYLEGFSLNLKELSDVVNINGHLVGLDKLGHFFAEGWQYFELTHEEGKTIEQAIAWGRQQEAGKYGYSTTGIFSFSDLVANFNGWRFWNRVLLREDDPLKSRLANFFSRPYVTCDIQVAASIKNMKVVKAWEFNSRFDLSDYIDGVWDEGNNCNSYDDPFIEEKVMKRIKEVDPGFKCPLKPEYCLQARDKYGRYAKYVLHPYCLIVDEG